MHLNKNHTISRRALAILLTLTLCLGMIPTAFAGQRTVTMTRRTLDADPTAR